jgi:flagellar biogenesis protein FliO
VSVHLLLAGIVIALALVVAAYYVLSRIEKLRPSSFPRKGGVR